MVGKIIPVPRLECIYGDKGCDYLYSKSVFLKPLPWTEPLAQLRDKITAATGYNFRIVIGNQYRSSQDSIGWHSDNEPSMGINPAIASVSLGAARKFQIKPIAGKPTDFWLEHGSLLVMHPGCQSTHLHQVPKTNKVVSTRINLTFRPHTGGEKRTRGTEQGARERIFPPAPCSLLPAPSLPPCVYVEKQIAL
jgi:alkylated DNA repair dioxygenase AlkB